MVCLNTVIYDYLFCRNQQFHFRRTVFAVRPRTNGAEGPSAFVWGPGSGQSEICPSKIWAFHNKARDAADRRATPEF